MSYTDGPNFYRPAPRSSPWGFIGPLILLFAAIAALVYFGWGWFHIGPANDPNARPRPVVERGELPNDEASVIKLFEDTSQSVVYITTSAVQRDRFTLDLLEIPKGTGSGIIWDEEGHIVTNNHVIEGASSAKVTLRDGSSHEARLTGRAPEVDLAVLKIDVPSYKLRPIPIGKSANLKVGQKAFAIGDPFGLDYTLTTGVVSALNRQIKTSGGRFINGVIQTDAAINPGNSGGPLLDSAGNLIGVNTAIFSPSGAYAGIGFAIPVDMVNQVVPQLIRTGSASIPKGELGITYVSDPLARAFGVRSGALIHQVFADSAAAEAGLRPSQETRSGVRLGDVIVAVDDQAVSTVMDAIRFLSGKKPGDVVRLQIVRNGQKQEVSVTLRGN